MHFLLGNLCDKLKCRKKIYIYGAGHYATEIYDRFCIIGWKNRIVNFVVTCNDAQPEYIDGTPVIEYNRKLLDDNDYIILVAVSGGILKKLSAC